MNKNENRSSFAKNLIALRKLKGLSQRDLAKLTGLSNRVIAYYETNSSVPSIDKLEKVANALKISIAELIDPHYSDKSFLKLNTRTLKKIKLLEQLSLKDQKKVLDYIQALIDQNKLKQEKQLQKSKS